MYLKRIEMKGFKSFADPVILEFNQGLNAIVGPNGSGKSNIIEAVRWVLGEQSAKQLRGEKMQDIIFQGTRHRRGMNHAYVTIVIDNTERLLPYDSDEITITRRLNRQNESEFELNQRQCRLKDITDLFTDSGVGKQSLAIISQGKIEAIFDHKPENRRQLFEEAAGVLKYKQRKVQTEKKLQETDEHMDRVDDVLYELNVQLEPLKDQAKVAERHQALSEELKALEIAHTGAFLTKKKAEQEQLLTIIQTHEECLKTMTQTTTEQEQQLQDERQQLIALEEQQERLQQEYVTLSRQLSQEQSKIDLWQERERHHEENEQRLQEQLFDLDSDLMRIVEQKAQAMTAQADEKKALDAQQQRVHQLEEEKVLLLQSTNQSIDDIRDDYFTCLQAQADLKNQWQETQTQYERQSLEQQQFVKQQQQLEATKAQLEQEEKQLHEQYQEAMAAFKSAEKQVNTVETAMDYHQKKYEEKQAQGRQALKQLEHWRAKVDTQRQLIQNRAHFFEGTRAVLEASSLAGIVGAVAECIEVEKDYTTALDVALGNSSQHIIVETEREALEAIHYLKKEKAGQATFLPRDVIQGQYLEDHLLETVKEMPGFVGLASDLVETDEANRAIIGSLLGKIVVVKTIEEATVMAKAIRYHAKFVTLDGDIVNPSGALTGGSRHQTTSLLQQKETLKQYEEQLQDYEAMYRTFTQRMQRLEEETTALQQQKEEAQVALQEAVIAKKQSEKLWQAHQQEVAVYQKERHLFDKEAEQRQYLEDVTLLEQQFNDQMAQLQREQQQLKVLMEQAQIGEKERLNRQNELQEALYQAKTELSVAKTKWNQWRQERDHLEEEEEKLTARKVALKEQQAILQGKQAEIDIDALKTLIERLKKEVTQKEQRVEALKEQKEIRVTQRNQLEKMWQQGLDERHRQEVTVQKEQQRLNQVEMALDDAMRYLSEEYQYTYERAVRDYPNVTEDAYVGQKIADLKKERKALGPINMEAMKQYNDVNERYQFMTSQREDLEQAKQQLLETMAEMDQEVKHRFLDTFNAISDAFSQLFPKMFGGGQAWLTLTHPDELLTTGIDIEVQPPGKKVKSMSLLSGGERALTAITLLFAVIQVRPVPFCILDEVEAALDEANVQRFSQYLTQFHDRQFIVITHRKGTMEMADALYGITMEEEGVSKVVSVKLEEQHD